MPDATFKTFAPVFDLHVGNDVPKHDFLNVSRISESTLRRWQGRGEEIGTPDGYELQDVIGAHRQVSQLCRYRLASVVLAKAPDLAVVVVGGEDRPAVPPTRALTQANARFAQLVARVVEAVDPASPGGVALTAAERQVIEPAFFELLADVRALGQALGIRVA